MTILSTLPVLPYIAIEITLPIPVESFWLHNRGRAVRVELTNEGKVLVTAHAILDPMSQLPMFEAVTVVAPKNPLAFVGNLLAKLGETADWEPLFRASARWTVSVTDERQDPPSEPDPTSEDYYREQENRAIQRAYEYNGY